MYQKLLAVITTFWDTKNLVSWRRPRRWSAPCLVFPPAASANALAGADPERALRH